MPAHWLAQASPAHWLSRIEPVYQDLKGIAAPLLRNKYMEKVTAMPLYGSVQMPVQYALNSTLWTRYTLAITQKGVMLIEGYNTVWLSLSLVAARSLPHSSLQTPVRQWAHTDITAYSAMPSYFIFLTGSLLDAHREVMEVVYPRLLAEIYTAFLKAANLLAS